MMKWKDFLFDWGYASTNDLLHSTLHFNNYKTMALASFSMGSISVFFNKYLGLELITYLAFFVLLILEFLTGVSASYKEGKKFNSNRFNRFLVKIIIYTLMIAITNILKNSFVNMKMGAVYEFIYWTILHIITIQLIVSVFENLSRLGFQESSRIFGRLHKYLSKWFDLIDDKFESKEDNK